MNRFTVETLTADDIPAVISIAEEANLSHWSERDLLDELLLKEAIMLKLVGAEANCVGFVLGRIVPGFVRDFDAELYNIGLTASVRRNGGGSMLMAQFIKTAVSRRARNIWLDVRESNTTAISFYRKFGFIEDGLRKRFYTNPVENAVLMRLVLSD